MSCEDLKGESGNLLVALQLQKRPEILSKSQLPHLKKRKDEALHHVVLELQRQMGKQMTTSQLLKKVNNMKTRLKSKVDRNKTGNVKIILSEWEQIVLELMDGEENPTITKIRGAKSVGPPDRTISSKEEIDLDNDVQDANLSLYVSTSLQSDNGSTNESEQVPLESPRRPVLKRKRYETEETSKMNTQELQRLVLIEQLNTARVQRQYYEQRIAGMTTPSLQTPTSVDGVDM